MKFRNFAGCMLSAVIALSCVSAFGAYIDVDNETLGEKISVLEQLGIMQGYDDATYRPDEAITREEFETGVSGLFNEDTTAVNEDAQIEDTGISYAEAVKILLDGMGYGAVCEIRGGFPTGYLKLASRIGLGSGAEESLTRKKAADLFYNALETGVMEFQGISGGGTDFAVSDETVMKKFHNLEKLSGIMSYNGITSLDGTMKEPAAYVVVGGVKIDAETGVYAEYLGYNMNVYAQKDDASGRYYAKAAAAAGEKNKKVRISSENIAGVTGGARLRAEYGTVTKTYNFDGAAVIRNGSYCPVYDDAMFMPKEGFVELIDNNADNRYEVAIVYDVIDDVISGVNSHQEIIYFQDYGGVDLTEQDVYVYIDGKKRSLSDVNSGNAVSMAVGTDDNIMLWVSTQRYNGVISSSDEECLVIVGKTYPVSAYLKIEGENISLGKAYTMYVSSFGKAVKLDFAAKTDEYGWIMKILYDDNLDEAQDADLKILSGSGGIVRVGIGKKIRVNDVSYKRRSKAFGDNGIVDAEGRCVPQLIKYSTDDSGTLTNIYTAVDKTALGICSDAFSLDRRVRGVSTRMYRYNIGINYHLGAATKVFYLPLDNEISSADDEDYSVGGIGTFSQDINYSNFDIYDTRADRTAGVLVIRRSIQPAKVTDKLTDALMKRDLGVVVKSQYTNDGDEEVSVRMLTGGKESVFKASSVELTNSYQDSWKYTATTVKDLKRGDVVLYSKNEKGEISDFTILMLGTDAYTGVFRERTPGNIAVDVNNDVALTPLHTVFGEVCDINTNTFSINITKPWGGRPAPNEMRHLCASASANVYIVDYGDSSCTVGALTDICIGDVVFMRAYNYVPQQIIIYRGL